MITRTCIFFLSFLLISRAQAQIKPFSFGVYAEGLFHTGDTVEAFNNGFGGGLDFQFRLPVKFTFTGSAGLLHFGEKTLSSTTKLPEMNLVALRAGARYRVNLFYLKLETGAVMPLKGGPATAVLSPGLGFKLAALDLQAKYEIWMGDTEQSFPGARLAIIF